MQYIDYPHRIQAVVLVTFEINVPMCGCGNAVHSLRKCYFKPCDEYISPHDFQLGPGCAMARVCAAAATTATA
jgi:hypothetical protein